MAPVIIATDKTQLTQFSGSKSAYPVYLTLGNLPRALRRRPSQHACILIGKKQKSARIQQLFHDSMCIILEPLIQAGQSGVDVTGGDGHVRRVYPILACYVADYPEQCLVTSAKYGSCPKCDLDPGEIGQRWAGTQRIQKKTKRIIRDSIGHATSISHFQELCKEHNVSGGVYRPFWDGLPHCDIHLSITPDILHQLYQGIVKYLVLWCTSLMSEKELDKRIQCLPPCFGVRHFKRGWSHLSQISGNERKDMARILLGCLIGKAPSQFIACYRALLDFIYIAQYPSHDDDSLQYLEDALNLFHSNKAILTDSELGIRDHLNLPKIHSMVHYTQSIKAFGTTDNYNTEMFERFHIDYAKEGWRASNFRDEVPQMTVWLLRQEKVAMFQSYLKNYTIEWEGPLEDQTAENQDHAVGAIGRGIFISSRPAVAS